MAVDPVSIALAASQLGTGLAGLFGGNKAKKTANKVSEDLLKWLRQWYNVGGAGGAKPGSGIGSILQGMTDKQAMAGRVIPQLEKFYGGLIPRNFSELSPAVEAMKQSALQGLGTQTESARVGQMGSLQRRFGGRMPYSALQSGFGTLARGQQETGTEIGREAIANNISLGGMGAAGLAQLPYMGNPALSDFMTLLSGGASTAGLADASKGQGFASLAGGLAQLLGAMGLGKTKNPAAASSSTPYSGGGYASF